MIMAGGSVLWLDEGVDMVNTPVSTILQAACTCHCSEGVDMANTPVSTILQAA